MVFGRRLLPTLDFFAGKPFGDRRLGVGILGDVNRLFLLLKRPHDVLEMGLPISEERPNNVFSGRADRQTVRRFVVRPVGQTLPHRGRLCIADSTAVVAGVLAVGHLLDPIGEAAHELPVVMGVAGREVKIPSGEMAPTGHAATHSLHSRQGL